MVESEPEVTHNVSINFYRASQHVWFECSCGAHWKVSKEEFENDIDHIEDHKRYANKAPIKPD
jgi:hypothetical protein